MISYLKDNKKILSALPFINEQQEECPIAESILKS